MRVLGTVNVMMMNGVQQRFRVALCPSPARKRRQFYVFLYNFLMSLIPHEHHFVRYLWKIVATDIHHHNAMAVPPLQLHVYGNCMESRDSLTKCDLPLRQSLRVDAVLAGDNLEDEELDNTERRWRWRWRWSVDGWGMDRISANLQLDDTTTLMIPSKELSSVPTNEILKIRCVVELLEDGDGDGEYETVMAQRSSGIQVAVNTRPFSEGDGMVVDEIGNPLIGDGDDDGGNNADFIQHEITALQDVVHVKCQNWRS